jgi:AraC-like DNA-binding protein
MRQMASPLPAFFSMPTSSPASDPWPLAELFDSLEDVQFWIKDTQHRYLHANRALLLNYGLADLADLAGKTDYDVSPPFLADQFWLDDEQVVKGLPVVNRIELVGGAGEHPRWSVTNKIPLHGADGQIAGTAGTTRWMDAAVAVPQKPSSFDQVLAYIRDHYQSMLSNDELARAAGLSVRAFERRFKQTFQVTPQAYIRKVRVRTACRLLVYSDLPLAQVAIEAGFADQSHFNHEFRRQLGRTPGDYRLHYRR